MVGRGLPGWIEVGNGGGGGFWGSLGSWVMSSGAGVLLTALEGVASR